MKHLFFLLLFGVALTGCGPRQPDTFDKSPTANGRVNIPGTRLFIAPPADFKVATNFIGLEHADNSSFQVMDLVGGNFYTNAGTFSREEFEARGAQVLDYKDTTISSFPAKYAHIQGEPTTQAFMITFGDTTFSTMVMAMVPADAKPETLTQVERAMFSIRYDKELKVDPFATAPFVLDDRQSKYKFVKFSGNMYVYSANDPEQSPQPDAAVITVTPLPREEGASAASFADMITESLEKYGLTDKVTKNTSVEPVNGDDAYEVEIHGNMKGQKALFYELVVVHDERGVLVQGVIPEGLEANLPDIRRFARTIRFK